MKHRKCNYGDTCRYWHPKKLKNISQTIENKTEKPFTNEEKPTYANIVKKTLQPQFQSNVPFLGITPVHQDSTGQVHQVQQPIIGQTNHVQRNFLDIQNKQKQIMELFINLNQKMNNMYSMEM